MNIVTKSGTNDLQGSCFTLFRDKSDELEDTTEKNNASRSRTTAATSSAARFGGPIVKNKAHYFAAAERTQQDTKQVVNTLGMFPARTACTPRPTARTCSNMKVSANLSTDQYLSVRYGRNTNSQLYGATARRC